MIDNNTNQRQALNAMLDATRYAKFFVTSDRLHRAAAALETLRRAPIIGSLLYWRALRAALSVLTVYFWALAIVTARLDLKLERRA